MKIGNTNIDPHKVSMWMNILSFIVGFLFYLRLEYNKANPVPIPTINPLQDSSVWINARLTIKVKQLQTVQDSLVKQLYTLNQKQEMQRKQIVHQRRVLISTVNQDWDSLNTDQQNVYIHQLLSNLKSKAR